MLKRLSSWIPSTPQSQKHNHSGPQQPGVPSRMHGATGPGRSLSQVSSPATYVNALLVPQQGMDCELTCAHHVNSPVSTLVMLPDENEDENDYECVTSATLPDEDKDEDESDYERVDVPQVDAEAAAGLSAQEDFISVDPRSVPRHDDSCDSSSELPKARTEMAFDVFRNGLHSGAHAAKQALLNGTIASLGSPGSAALLLAQGAAVGAAVGLVKGALDFCKGTAPIDHFTTIREAQQWLRVGVKTRALAPSQRVMVEAWIDEARQRLELWRKENSQSATLEGLVSAPAAYAGKKGRAIAVELPAAAKDASLQSVLTATEKAQEALNPSQRVLAERDAPLGSVLMALQQVKQWPHRVRYTDSDEVAENIKRHPAVGAKEFIDRLKTRACMLAQDAFETPEAQTKRVLLAVSGPGTGKTTSIKAMARWAGLDCVVLTGEGFNDLCAKQRSIPPYDVFIDWVAQSVLQGFNGHINGMLLLDDFHKAFEGNCGFAACNTSRAQFFHWLKVMGDAAQDSIIDVVLAPERRLRLNLERVNLVMTLNRRPPELVIGDEALLSRCVDLGAIPMTADDRRARGEALGAELCARIATKLGAPLEPAMMEACRDSFNKLVDLDLHYWGHNLSQAGNRGVCDLLKSFYEHIDARVNAMIKAGQAPTPALFAFAPDFDLNATAAGISEYKMMLDAGQAKEEQRKQVRRQIDDLREAVNSQYRETLLGANKLLIESMLDTAAASSSDGKQWVVRARERLQDYTHHIVPIKRDQLAKNLDDLFSYYKGGSNENDCFVKLSDVALRILRRVNVTIAGCYDLIEPGSNKPVQVNWLQPKNKTLGLYNDLGSALGGLPVRVLNHESQVIDDSQLRPYIVNDSAKAASMYDSVVSLGGFTRLLRREAMFGEMIYYFAEGNDYYICKSATIDVLNNKVCKFTDTKWFTRCHSLKAFMADVEPTWRLFDNVLTAGNNPPQSYAHSIIVVRWTEAMAASVARWASSRQQTDEDAETTFLRHLHEELNKPQITLSDGRTFDPRGLTVFIDGTGKNAESFRRAETSFVVPWSLGNLPLQGRARRAARLRTQELARLRAEAINDQKIFNESATPEFAPEAIDEAALQRLIAFDRDMYERAKAVGIVLSLESLEAATCWLARAIATRQSHNPFARLLDDSMDVTTKPWDEFYELDRIAINEAAAQREAEEKAQAQRAEAEAKAQAEAEAKAQAEAKAEAEAKSSTLKENPVSGSPDTFAS